MKPHFYTNDEIGCFFTRV